MSCPSILLLPTAVPSSPICTAPQSNPHRMMEGAVGISSDNLVQMLSRSDGESTLVLDCRPFMAYNQGHVMDAVNVHCPPILKRRSGGFVALENIVPCCHKRERLLRGCFTNVVVYDRRTEDLTRAITDTDSNLYSVLKSLLQQVDLDRVFYLIGGYEAFSEECPLLCATHEFTPRSHVRSESRTSAQNDKPVEILPHLLLGNMVPSSCRERLQALGVTALVNVSTSCANHFEADFRYLNIPVNDSASADLAVWFSTANEFIDSVQRDGGRVLVHCHAGRSRSVTICLAYLMRTYNWTLDAAYEHVRARRDIIDPNLNFMRQLQDYRRRLDNTASSVSSSAAAITAASSAMATSLSSASMDSEVSSVSPTPAPLPPTPEPVFQFPGAAMTTSNSRTFSVTRKSSQSDSVNDVSMTPEVPSPLASATDIQCYFTFSTNGFTFPKAALSAMAPLTWPS